MTIVEVLLVIGLIGVLAGLTIPAVAEARASARRLQCQNRLHQLGLAQQGYEASFRVLPAFGLGNRFSVHARILPYLGRLDLYDQIDFEQSILREPAFVISRQKSGGELETVSEFLCPADGDNDTRKGMVNFRVCRGAVEGPAGWPSNPVPVGRPARLAGFTDGASRTALMSERVVGDFDDQRYTPWRDVWLVPIDTFVVPRGFYRDACARLETLAPSHYSDLGKRWLLATLAHTGYTHYLGPNSTTPDCAPRPVSASLISGAVSARSYHAGGVNVLMVDGSVAFVAESIDFRIWEAMGTKNLAD